MNRQAYRGCVLACGVALLALVTVAQAKTLYVNNGGKTDYRSIDAALEAATSGDIIIIGPGTYSGGTDITDRVVTLRSRDPNSPTVVAGTVIDCRFRAFNVFAGSYTHLTLSGLTIRNGAGRFDGGAMLCEGADLDAINCTFKNNTTALSGGAVFCHNSRVRFVGCTFSGNTSQALRGGAIFCSSSHLDLTDCSFEASKGSAVMDYDSELTLTGCTFRNNSGEDGGAIHSRKDASNEIAPRLTLTRCTFADNSADALGGAMYSFRVRMTLTACRFTGNTAGQDGGALSNSDSSPSLVSCVFLHNAATGVGGAISNLDSSSPMVVNCTLVGNTALAGGAISTIGQGKLLVSHSILWGNAAGQGKHLSLAPGSWDFLDFASVTVEYSDLQGGRTGIDAAPDCEVTWSSGNIDADPLFLANDDFNLSVSSPCIDGGDPSYLPDANTQDLAGNPRLSGSTVDMGAYESSLAPVYRFWSPVTERHFYTMSRGERDKLIRDYSKVWTYECIAFYASSRPLDNMLPVHRLWSARQSSHFWTTDEKEYQRLLKESPDLWTYERIDFYVYPPFKQPWGTVPVYRFWWSQRGGHFYTASEGEKDKLLPDSKTWTYEGIVWYVFPTPKR